MPKSERKQKIGILITSIVFVVLGTLAILYPDALQGQEAHGRRAGLKALVIWLWGRPAGIVLALLGLLGFLGTVKEMRERKEVQQGTDSGAGTA